jgi:hypothetical protein
MRERIVRTDGTDEMVSSLDATEALDDAGLQVYEPVVGNPERGISLRFGGAVVTRGGGGENLNHKGRCPFDASRRDKSGIGHDHEVGLDHIVRGQDDIDRSVEHFPSSRSLEIFLQEPLEPF